MKFEPQTWWHLPESVRFLIAGIYNTVFGYAAFAFFYWLLNSRLNYLWAGVMAQAVALISAFSVYRLLVFASRDRWLVSFARFNLSQLATCGIGLLGLYALVRLGGVKPLLAQAILTVIAACASYVMHKYFSFRHRPLGKTT